MCGQANVKRVRTESISCETMSTMSMFEMSDEHVCSTVPCINLFVNCLSALSESYARGAGSVTISCSLTSVTIYIHGHFSKVPAALGSPLRSRAPQTRLSLTRDSQECRSHRDTPPAGRTRTRHTRRALCRGPSTRPRRWCTLVLNFSQVTASSHATSHDARHVPPRVAPSLGLAPHLAPTTTDYNKA